jgi:multidrug efflux pump subunit AcrA (membrane-fusion protein)
MIRHKRVFQTTIPFATAIVLCCGTCRGTMPEESLFVDEMLVVLVDSVNVPAGQSGVIAEIAVREGQVVKVGHELASLDDRRARLEEAVAQTQLEIATEKAAHGLATSLARKQLAQQRQLARQHEIAGEIADRKAKNEVRILASKKAEAVAKNELERATRARREFVDSVSQSEIDSLRLAYERTSLETEQADFERRVDILQAKAESEAAAGHALAIERYEIELQQASADQRVQELEVELQRHRTELAKLERLHRKVFAPLGGVVVQRFCNQGDWVNAGDPVVRVVRLDRLRAEGFVSSDQVDRLRARRNVVLEIQSGADSVIKREGKVVFISPEIDPVNNELRFWVEFDNPKRDVLPGMRLSLRSKP